MKDKQATPEECLAFREKRLRFNERRALEDPARFLRDRGIEPGPDPAAQALEEFAKGRAKVEARELEKGSKL